MNITVVMTDLQVTAHDRQDNSCSSLPKSIQLEVAWPSFLTGRANIHMSAFTSLYVHMAQVPTVKLFENIPSTTGNFTAGFSRQTLLLSGQLQAHGSPLTFSWVFK